MRRKLIAGNWKMHGSVAHNEVLLRSLRQADPVEDVDMVVLVPAPYLGQVRDGLQGSHYAWGGQDISDELQGAFTGEVAASMLRDFDCHYVIVGHSERRQRHGETDQLVARKAQQALEAGLTPIVCLGETLAQREAGETHAVVRRQFGAIIEALGPQGMAFVVLAYEPIWAIGTGRSATAQQAQEVHQGLRRQMAEQSPEVAAELRLLYGGSVKASNAVELMSMPDIDGALVGGASLVAEEFLAIAQAASVK